MFLIKRLWIDTLENRDAFGFESIGFVSTKGEADRITNLGFVPKEKYPWPLKHAHTFKGDTVPMFIAEEIELLDGMNLKELNAI